MATAPPLLGPFELHLRFSAGAMGQIWWGRHTQQALPVAIKVLHPDWARDPHYLRAFRNEVRQVARLGHPNIILVLDHGEIPPEVEARTEGKLLAGSPYLVMEYASGGSVRERMGALDWGRIRTVLVTLLRSLAYVHARGVLHRDLKPENVLLTEVEDLARGLRLSDFGLAPPRNADEPDEGAAQGTPWYMAPEQIEGRAAQQGPWTDLYALGALAWELVTGAPPFALRTVRDTLHAALTAPLPPLRPRVSLPEGVDAWLRALLARDPTQRPAFAADALAGLDALQFPRARPLRAVVGVRPWAVTQGFHTVGPALDDEDPEPEQARLGPPAPPSTWKPEEAPELPRLIGAGLSLMPLRVPPLVGREAERDLLWAALLEVRRSGAPQVVLLSGPQGVGKSRLASWLAEHAAELGCARSLVLQDAMLTPADEREPPAERRGRALHRLRRAPADRPLVLVLDDLPASPDALLLVEAILAADADERGPLPVLVIATADDEVLASWPRRAEQIAAFAGHRSFGHRVLAPLEHAHITALIEHGFGLEPELASQAAQRAEGNPLFANQLVRAWTAGGLLEASAEGFRLRPGERAELPDDLHALWRQRVTDVLHLPPAHCAWLVVGAALGRDVDERLWVEATSAGGWTADAAGLDALLGAGLVRTTSEGWAFGHALLRESVIRDARQRGLWQAANRAAATAVARLRTGLARDALLGQLLLEAEDREAATAPLGQALLAQLDRSDWPAAQDLVETLDRALGPLPQSDARHGDLALLRIRLLLGRGEVAEADALAGRTAEEARRRGWSQVRVTALRYWGMTAQRLGQFQRAEALLLQAEGLATRAGQRSERARAHLHLGTVHRLRGDAVSAIGAFRQAEAGFEELGDRLGLADALSETANVLLTLLDDPAEAERKLSAAQHHYEAIGRKGGVAFCQTTLGELLRRRGETERAESAFQAALAVYEQAGSSNVAYLRINLGLLHLESRRLAEASAHFEAARVRARGNREVRTYAVLGQLAIAGLRENRQVFSALLAEAEALLEETGLIAPDLAVCAALAEQAARSQGDLAGAAAVQQILANQERALVAARAGPA